MGVSKYETNVRPYLDAIHSWRAQGATLETIAGNLQISKRSLMEYQKSHAELREALETSVSIANARVAGAMFTAAIGHTVTVRETTIETGGRVVTREREIYYPPDTKAAAMWLYNHDSGFSPERAIAERMAAKREAEDAQKTTGGVIQIPAINREGYEAEKQRELERLKAEEAEADG